MKEYKIICTIHQEREGKVIHRENAAPIVGGLFNRITKDYEEAKQMLEFAKERGAQYDERTRKNHELHKDMFVTTQTNYRIFSREVTEWEEMA